MDFLGVNEDLQKCCEGIQARVRLYGLGLGFEIKTIQGMVIMLWLLFLPPFPVASLEWPQCASREHKLDTTRGLQGFGCVLCPLDNYNAPSYLSYPDVFCAHCCGRTSPGCFVPVRD
jgi:hypothetical protein